MIRIKRAFLLAIILLTSALMVACQPIVRTDISTFRDEGAAFSTGTVRVIPEETEAGDSPTSLEFRFYKAKLESRLQAVGYTPVETENAQFTARLGYSVSRQEVDKPYSRVYVGGHIGYYHRYPRTSVVVSNSGDEFEYYREVQLSIEKPQVDQDAVVKVVQVKATSVGSCEHLTVVFDEMLDAIFTNLMRPDGSVEKVTVKGETRCP